ncbi:MAG: Tex-like N-terminal domain-containing protein [Thermoguttaceae bacterium]|jgi:uncharacterized protein|nr:Tex-like N-terminal domain-containing protein [Thermoguttaceae bacterium]
MIPTVTIDLRHVARGLSLPLRQVQAVVELLDEGNTVPFITRYRKDQTGGLDEEQIRHIQGRLEKLRQLADRKQTILRSIEAQGKLSEALSEEILAATTPKRLEDLYLPFKPRKQTLATQARERGLENLAREILSADPACADLDARAADFANPDRQVPTGADALLGAGHILAEQFSERADLRQKLREILHRTGVLVSARIQSESKSSGSPTSGDSESLPKQVAKATFPPKSAASEPSVPVTPEPSVPTDSEPSAPIAQESIAAADAEPAPPAALPTEPTTGQLEAAELVSPTPAELTESAPCESEVKQPVDDPPPSEPGPSGDSGSPGVPGPEPGSPDVSAPASGELSEPAPESLPHQEASSAGAAASESAPSDPGGSPADASTPQDPAGKAPADKPPGSSDPAVASRTGSTKKRTRRTSKTGRQPSKADRKLQKRKRIEEQQVKAFRDYFDFNEELRKIPPHRVLAINRGERARVLKVKVDADLDAMYGVIDEYLVPEGHPHAEYLRGCARDALARLILPALEREARRELTDKAESHAVSVFAKNLRNLLLQPPIHGHRVLAVDPGFRSGCKLAALDQFGNVLEHGVIYLVGRPERAELGKQKVIDMVRRYGLTVVAIGNGTACRQTEDFFATMLANELKEDGVAYVIVNEAGASVYSTSRLGREEFPNYDASLRGAISIGRRLLDPLSELVKIDAASIGVGLYQHDVRAKHLRTSLDEVVESCVNYVAVEVNTASPALLRYVSGLNQLTARRVYEYRLEHGPFRTREQLRDVPGFGEATFVQAAGFLKIAGGHNPLDATWIHPESYEVAARVLEKLDAQVDGLTNKEASASLADRARQANLEQLAAELQVGVLLLKDIVSQLVRPGRDPREDLPKPVFRRGVIKLEDLAPEMELTGTVLNVVDFGCFVDIGLHDSGLVHVSRLADRFVRDPHEVVAVGDVVKVWVLEVDKERRRVSLTMIPPGAPRAHRTGRQPQETDPSASRGTPPKRPGGPRDGEEGRGARRGGREAGDGRGRARGGGEGRGGRRGKPPATARPVPYRPKPRPKPTIPITDEMKAGKEPMRTFSDLLQFYSQKQPEAEPAPKADKPKKAQPEAQQVPQPEASEPTVGYPEAPQPKVSQPEAPEPQAKDSEVPQPAPPAEPPQNDPTDPNPAPEQS